MICAGCTTTDERLINAATVQGEAKAAIVLPDYPEECRQHVGRVYPTLGEKARWTQKRWEFTADNIDAQIDRCAGFYDALKSHIEGQ